MPTPDYFLNTRSSIVALETLEISHPSFSQVYRIVRNHSDGITATTEESVSRTFFYYPCNITRSTASDDLDYTLQVTFGDLGTILPQELDRVFSDGLIETKPIVKYREFQSDGSTHSLMYYGEPLQIASIAFNQDGCTFEAMNTLTNSTSIGMRYTTDTFPPLRGFA